MHSSRNERARARARLQSEAPVSEGADLPKLQAQVAEVMQESAQASAPADGAVPFEWHSVAQNYFGYVARKKAKTKARPLDPTKPAAN